jgi:cytochrome c biogenesis factor
VAVLASVFTREGSILTGQGFVDGLVPAVWIGAAMLAGGALLALAVPGRKATGQGTPAPVARPSLVPEISAS